MDHIYKNYQCTECGGFCELKICCDDPRGALPSDGCPPQCAIAKWVLVQQEVDKNHLVG